MAAIARDPSTYTIFNWPIDQDTRAEFRLTWDGYTASILRGKSSAQLTLNGRHWHIPGPLVLDRCIEKVMRNSNHICVFRSNKPNDDRTTVIGINVEKLRFVAFETSRDIQFLENHQPSITFSNGVRTLQWSIRQIGLDPAADVDVQRSLDAITIVIEKIPILAKSALKIISPIAITALGCKGAEWLWSTSPQMITAIFAAVIEPAVMHAKDFLGLSATIAAYTIEFLGYPGATLTGTVAAVSIVDACFPHYRIIEKILATAVAMLSRMPSAEEPAG